jgi:hypothetical protein
MSTDLEQREIVEVNELSDENDGVCFSNDCGDPATHEVQQTHEDEGEKIFYLDLCKSCLAEYTKAVDEAKIFDAGG